MILIRYQGLIEKLPSDSTAYSTPRQRAIRSTSRMSCGEIWRWRNADSLLGSRRPESKSAVLARQRQQRPGHLRLATKAKLLFRWLTWVMLISNENYALAGSSTLWHFWENQQKHGEQQRAENPRSRYFTGTLTIPLCMNLLRIIYVWWCRWWWPITVHALFTSAIRSCLRYMHRRYLISGWLVIIFGPSA